VRLAVLGGLLADPATVSRADSQRDGCWRIGRCRAGPPTDLGVTPVETKAAERLRNLEIGAGSPQVTGLA